MGYQVINKLHQFSFQHGTMLSCKKDGENIFIEIDGAVALYHNEYNDRSVNTYITTLSLRLFQAYVDDLFLEGYKYYDADGKLLDEVKDKPLEPEQLKTVVKLCEGGYIADSKISSEGEGRYFLQLQVDAVDSNDTYGISFRFEKSTAGWERFLQKAEEFTF